MSRVRGWYGGGNAAHARGESGGHASVVRAQDWSYGLGGDNGSQDAGGDAGGDGAESRGVNGGESVRAGGARSSCAGDGARDASSGWVWV